MLDAGHPCPAYHRGKLAAAVADTTLLGGGQRLLWRGCAAGLVRGAGRPAMPTITESLLPPSPMPNCSVAASGCLGVAALLASCVAPSIIALLAIAASVRPPSPMPQSSIAASGCAGVAALLALCGACRSFLACHRNGLAAAVADAALLGGGQRLLWRGCAARLVRGAGCPCPACHRGGLAAAVADAALLRCGQRLLGVAALLVSCDALPVLTLLAITAYLLPPSLVPHCSMAARSRVGVAALLASCVARAVLALPAIAASAWPPSLMPHCSVVASGCFGVAALLASSWRRLFLL